jgi:hypothetical protein
LEVLEKTGVFLSVTECWRELDEAAWMLPSFQLHFTSKADKEHHHKLMVQTVGYYHGAHTITAPTNATPLAAAVVAIASAPLAAPPLQHQRQRWHHDVLLLVSWPWLQCRSYKPHV